MIRFMAAWRPRPCRHSLLALTLSLTLALPSLASDPTQADGWINLLQTGANSPWQKVDPAWIVTCAVALDPEAQTKLRATPAPDGRIWVNGENGNLPDLLTKARFADCEVHIEFMLAKKSNSGIKFHALYEVQLTDSADKPTDKLTGADCGGIYPRAELLPRYKYLDKGIPPLVNAAKPAGEWQTLNVTFRAPRFDEETGRKSENARIVRAALNGVTVQENVELRSPTGHNHASKESPKGPFMLQADHGPVAFRNCQIRAIDPVTLIEDEDIPPPKGEDDDE